MKANSVKIFRARKAQALTELTILGTLIIVAFAFLINYSERLNREQSYLQQTFRAALKEARGAGISASYTKVAFRRLPNVASPMELGQMQNYSSNASVLWSNGTSEANPVSKYQLNEDAAIGIPYSDEPAAGTVETSTNTFINDTNSIVTFTKTEGSGAISTVKTLHAEDQLTANVNIGGTDYSFTHYLGADGKYYPVPGSLDRTTGSRQ